MKQKLRERGSKRFHLRNRKSVDIQNQQSCTKMLLTDMKIYIHTHKNKSYKFRVVVFKE